MKNDLLYKIFQMHIFKQYLNPWSRPRVKAAVRPWRSGVGSKDVVRVAFFIFRHWHPSLIAWKLLIGFFLKLPLRYFQFKLNIYTRLHLILSLIFKISNIKTIEIYRKKQMIIFLKIISYSYLQAKFSLQFLYFCNQDIVYILNVARFFHQNRILRL